MIATCNLCKDNPEIPEPFSVAWDHIGQALMTEHLREVHKYERVSI